MADKSKKPGAQSILDVLSSSYESTLPTIDDKDQPKKEHVPKIEASLTCQFMSGETLPFVNGELVKLKIAPLDKILYMDGKLHKDTIIKLPLDKIREIFVKKEQIKVHYESSNTITGVSYSSNNITSSVYSMPKDYTCTENHPFLYILYASGKELHVLRFDVQYKMREHFIEVLKSNCPNITKSVRNQEKHEKTEIEL